MISPRARSLRFRFAIASLLWVGIGTMVAGFVISGLYGRHVTHTFVSDLANHLDELISLTEQGPGGLPVLDRPLSDPRFQHSRSGFYWQVERGGRPMLTSASLAGHHLRSHGDQAPDVPIWTRDHGERLLRIDRVGSDGLLFSITASGRVLDAELSAFHGDLAVSLGAFALLMLIGAALQVRYGLRPVQRLSGWIDELRRGERSQVPDAVPSEFAGIVGRLNELIEAQSVLVSRARIEAGNLGHNLRTPLALVISEAEDLANAGQVEPARFILEQCDRMQRQIDYQMRRAAAAGARGTGTVADFTTFTAQLVEAMRRLHAERTLSILNEVPTGVSVSCDPGDLTEMLSNLVDNACKWARGEVRIGASATTAWVDISVIDDGPGIPDSERVRVLDVGVRLDQSKPGTGLGLAVSRDLAGLYGGALELLPASPTGGLIARLRLPR